MADPVAFGIDDDLALVVQLAGKDICQDLDGIEILALAADDDVGGFACDIEVDLLALPGGNGGRGLVSHVSDHLIDESADLALKFLVGLEVLFFLFLFGFLGLGNVGSPYILFLVCGIDMDADLYIGLLEKASSAVVQDLDIEILSFNM